MTLKELKDRIAATSQPELFEDMSVIFDFHYISLKIELKGFTSIFEFANKQFNGWNKIEGNIPNNLLESKKYFNRIITIIEAIDYSYILNDRNLLNRKKEELRNSIINTNVLPFTYNCPETEFLLSVNASFPDSFNSAFNFFDAQNRGITLSNKRDLIGSLLAYEFTLKDHSKIIERRNAEKASLGKLRNDFIKYISESENQLNEHLKNANDRYSEYAKNIDELKSQKEKLYNEWYKKSESAAINLYTDSSAKISELETTYAELLKLKKPADYWKARAARLKSQGWWSLGILIFLVLVGCTSLYFLLWKTPEGMLKTFFGNDKTAALRWSLIFITFISFLAFCIRALNKVTFSSFHLARDAEERESLTYFYLALINEAEIDKDQRQLIMQSLFSRADTGLLKEDSAPSMPGIGNLIGTKLQ
jgi:hypothetical protein